MAELIIRNDSFKLEQRRGFTDSLGQYLSENTRSKRDRWKEEGWTRRAAEARGRIRSGKRQVRPLTAAKM